MEGDTLVLFKQKSDGSLVDLTGRFWERVYSPAGPRQEVYSCAICGWKTNLFYTNSARSFAICTHCTEIIPEDKRDEYVYLTAPDDIAAHRYDTDAHLIRVWRRPTRAKTL